jgi:Skp family chaperone for outer membrane proteins
MSFVFQQKGFTGMRVFAVALALSAMLAAGPSYAQASSPRPAPAAQAAPARTTPAAQGQSKPAAPAPTQPAAQQPAAPAAEAKPQPPFPAGVKYAFIYVQRIAAESAEGKADTAKVQALNQQKVDELNAKNKTLQTAQTKLEQGGNVLSESARAQLASDIEKQQKDIQRFTEDAQQEVQNLQQQLQDDFQQKLQPVIAKIAQEKQLHMIFSVTDSGLVWGDPALDLTSEVIREFDTATKAGAAKK